MDLKYFNRVFGRPGLQLVAAIVIAVCTITLLAAFVTGKAEGEGISKRLNIAVRAIGHDLLLRAGDSTSVVSPVIEKSNGVFLLEFENEFVFQPDTLAAIVQRILNKTGLSKYTVTVHEFQRPEIVYGFEINPPFNTIQSCSGRIQPKARYTIEIAFADFPNAALVNSRIVITISGVLSALAIVLISRNLRTKKLKPLEDEAASSQNESNPVVTIGKFALDTTHQRLIISEKIIALTDKECKILMVLNRNMGRLTLREELIQEVWTDEGVITGRSLDVFISKLRKKLTDDPDLRITNVHGKGYRLEIVDHANAG